MCINGFVTLRVVAGEYLLDNMQRHGERLHHLPRMLDRIPQVLHVPQPVLAFEMILLNIKQILRMRASQADCAFR